MTDLEAQEVSLDASGEDAFLRLSSRLPALSRDLAALSKGARDLALSLLVVPPPTGVGLDASLDEVAEDVRALAKQLGVTERLDAEVLLDGLERFAAWRLGSPLSKAEGKESVGVFLRLPPKVAGGFPRKVEDSSPVHATILMVGPCTADEHARVLGAVRSVAARVEPFKVQLADYGEFKNAKGQTIPHMIPRAEGPASLEALHKELRSGVENALGRKADHHDGPFKAHVTLGYVEEGDAYDGPRPSGRFDARHLEVWGDPDGKFGRARVELGTGAVVARLAANKSDLSGGDLSARGGALAPAQGTDASTPLAPAERPLKRPRRGELGGDPGRLYPGEDLGLPDSRVEAERTTLRVKGTDEEFPSLSLSILKRAADDAGEEDQRTVFGVVLEPEVVDAQNDIYSADEIRKSAWSFLERYQQFGHMHRSIVPSVLPLESYLAPVDLEVDGPRGKEKIKKGTWLLRVRVLDDGLWAACKRGELDGFSIGGSAVRRAIRSSRS